MGHPFFVVCGTAVHIKGAPKYKQLLFHGGIAANVWILAIRTGLTEKGLGKYTTHPVI